MTTRGNSGSEFEALGLVLDTWGADRRRWPDGARARFAPLLMRDAAARRLLAEAEALDRLLEAGAGEPSVGPALADRILAAALAEAPARRSPAARSQPTAEATNVVPFGRRAAAAPMPKPLGRRSPWQIAALMAASLLAGLYIGAGGRVATIVEQVAGLVGSSLDSDPVIALIGQEESGTGDEDLL